MFNSHIKSILYSLFHNNAEDIGIVRWKYQKVDIALQAKYNFVQRYVSLLWDAQRVIRDIKCYV